MNSNKTDFIRWKIYFDRARMYIGYLQFFMIGFVFLESVRDTSVGSLMFEHIYLSFPILIILVILLSLIVGKLDSKYGLREEEQRNYAISNPILREIHANMEEVKNEITALSKNSSAQRDAR